MLLQPRDIIIICGLKKALRERHQQWLAGDGAFVATVSLVEVVAVLVLAVVLFGESLKQSSQCDAAAASWWYPQSMLAPVTCYIKDNISVRPCIAVLRLVTHCAGGGVVPVLRAHLHCAGVVELAWRRCSAPRTAAACGCWAPHTLALSACAVPAGIQLRDAGQSTCLHMP